MPFEGSMGSFTTNNCMSDINEMVPYLAVKDRKHVSYGFTGLDRKTFGYACLFPVGAVKELGHKVLRLESNDEPVTLRLEEDELASLPTGERLRKEAPARDIKTNNALSEERTGHRWSRSSTDAGVDAVRSRQTRTEGVSYKERHTRRKPHPNLENKDTRRPATPAGRSHRQVPEDTRRHVDQSAKCGVSRAMPTEALMKKTKAGFAPSYARQASVPRRAFRPGTCCRQHSRALKVYSRRTPPQHKSSRTSNQPVNDVGVEG